MLSSVKYIDVRKSYQNKSNKSKKSLFFSMCRGSSSGHQSINKLSVTAFIAFSSSDLWRTTQQSPSHVFNTKGLFHR